MGQSAIFALHNITMLAKLAIDAVLYAVVADAGGGSRGITRNRHAAVFLFPTEICHVSTP